MPIEIRELVVKVNLEEPNRSSNQADRSESVNDMDKSAMIEECVNQISSMIKRKKER